MKPGEEKLLAAVPHPSGSALWGTAADCSEIQFQHWRWHAGADSNCFVGGVAAHLCQGRGWDKCPAPNSGVVLLRAQLEDLNQHEASGGHTFTHCCYPVLFPAHLQKIAHPPPPPGLALHGREQTQQFTRGILFLILDSYFSLLFLFTFLTLIPFPAVGMRCNAALFHASLFLPQLLPLSEQQ